MSDRRKSPPRPVGELLGNPAHAGLLSIGDRFIICHQISQAEKSGVSEMAEHMEEKIAFASEVFGLLQRIDG
jgi:hypothetical protein